jgi:hypothetical protein
MQAIGPAVCNNKIRQGEWFMADHTKGRMQAIGHAACSNKIKQGEWFMADHTKLGMIMEWH